MILKWQKGDKQHVLSRQDELFLGSTSPRRAGTGLQIKSGLCMTHMHANPQLYMEADKTIVQ